MKELLFTGGGALRDDTKKRLCSRLHRAKTLLKKVELVTHVVTRYAPNKLEIFWFTRAEQKVWEIIFLPQEVQPEGMGYLK